MPRSRNAKHRGRPASIDLQDGVNASLLILLKNPYWSPFDPHWRCKNADDSGRMRGFSAESTFDNLNSLDQDGVTKMGSTLHF